MTKICLKHLRFNKKKRRDFIALANSGGGILQWGWNVQGELIGFRSIERMRQEIQSLVSEIPGLSLAKMETEFWEDKKRYTLIVYVSAAKELLSYQGKYLIWVGGEIKDLSEHMVKDWKTKEGRFFYENQSFDIVQMRSAWEHFKERRLAENFDENGNEISSLDLDLSTRTLESIHTQDGTTSLYFKELDETYHSSKGAWEEALWVFIDKGFLAKAQEKNKMRILEVGFGTGLNAALTWDRLQKYELEVEYHGLEPYLIGSKDLDVLNYREKWPKETHQIWLKMHQFAHRGPQNLGKMKFECHPDKIQNYQRENFFDVIYFDAFAPKKQSELWTVDVFEKCYRLLCTGGILTTYCANGQFKRNLKKAGFELESLPGPPGRREMVRAKKA